MAISVSRISCCQLKPPAPSRGGGGGTATARPLLRRACVAAAAAAAACVVAGATTGLIIDGGGGGAAIAREMAGGAPHVDAAVVVRVQQQGPVARWSDRRQCPPWHANSLENIVPENLPRPSGRRRFNGVTAAQRAPAPDGSGPAASSASPDAVVPFLALRSGMGCFSL